MASIEVKNLHLTYESGSGEFTALQDVNFSVNDGEFVSILGSSGCGKSTLLNLFAGLISPTKGEILIDGKRVAGTGRDRSVVFQHYSLFPWMNAKKNITFALKQNLGRQKEHILREKADKYLKLVGLKNVGHKFPRELSGGMQQRVAIARALALDSRILLMDEPFGAIDARNRARLQELLLDLWNSEEHRKTVIFVTHDIDEAILLSDRIIVMSADHGRVRDQFHVKLQRPRNRDEVVRTPEYTAIRNKIVLLFYDDIADVIGGEEVVL